MKFNQELFDTSDEEGKGLLIAFLEKKRHIFRKIVTSTALIYSLRRTAKRTIGK